MPRSRLALSLLAFTVLATAAPASAQTPFPAPEADPLDARDGRRVERMEKVVRELRGIVFQMRDTGKPVVVQPADTDARMEELSSRIGDLEQTLRRLNGTLETTTFELEQAKRENGALRTQLQSMSDKLAAIEQAATAAPSGGVPPPPPPPVGNPTDAFARARQLMLSGDYDGAETAFAGFVEAFPDHQRTPEARYWLGKTQSVRGAHTDAAAAYLAAIRGWPQTSWAPDAVVELARSLVALKKPQDACRTLAELPKRYPKAPANITSRAASTRTQAKCAA
ncbi:tol-pal system protein YbgF [Phenylobacterium sp. J426]|uniref:tol-pal system protein YbgF n=1 Tax=Phenylobacterium sp. J426 TaxID=2898439 RepID=UPI002151779B|nr:tol-pal system protein YbgF [Phenylobacterium sp. J426]MCR5874434.1 tol-pal system protein YbgF [Phenylobacterium sp. J426]